MAHSEPVFLLLQASSAAHLSRHNPKMRLKALSLQSEAFSAVRSDIEKLQGPSESFVSDELMLCTIIAGLTSAWYDVNDLGLSHILGSQVLLYLWLQQQKNRLKYQQTFILGAFVYWFMISAFVAGEPKGCLEYQESLQMAIRSLEMSHDIVDDTDVPKRLRRIIPHPLTGFSIILLNSVGKVGALCRIRQNETIQRPGESLPDFLMAKARLVESELLEHTHSSRSNFTDPQDPQTTIDEILSVEEAYRCAGLLQLYTAFPHLLQRQAFHTFHGEADALEPESLREDKECKRLNSVGEFTPPQYNWLRALAFHILQILETVPATSGTRVLQGLAVLIAAAWLVDPMSVGFSSWEGESREALLEHSQLPLKKSSATKEQWRDIIRFGLRTHVEYVGLQQVSRVLEIVEVIWRLDDLGGKKCDWMAVVALQGLQTLFG
ncbi:hypothetical protein BP5796_03540 [Coleophoma crateriformis]|uniref:Transcription factor domain-containing protein n=1 Tax=Coleophoma crateriformis TaxID=565419 RepID=A0A3D8SNI5_9HELO|nr:hypothetical protein BP5796_03540 [Coleophoma crateriformis]